MQHCDQAFVGSVVSCAKKNSSGPERLKQHRNFSPAQAYSALVEEPFNLSFEQIANLTDYQISVILFGERNKEGRKEPLDDIPQRTIFHYQLEKQKFITMATALGTSREVAEKQWISMHGEN